MIPESIFGITNAVFLIAFIVVFPEYLKKGGNARSFTSTVGIILSIFLLIIVLVVIFFAKFITQIIAPGFTGQQLELTIFLVRILSVSIFFFGLSSFMTGILNYEHHFLLPKAARVIMGVILILILVTSEAKVQTLAIGTIVGIATVVVLEYVLLKKNGYTFSFFVDKKAYDAAKEMLMLSTPLIISSVIYYVTKTVMNIFATTQGVGSVSILNYAFLIAAVPVIFFSGSVSSILFPYITKSYVHEKEEEAKRIFLKSVSVLLVVFIPVTVLFLTLSTDIIRIFFERGEFTAASTEAVSTALSYYAIGIIPSGIWASILSLFYARKKVWEQLCLYILFLIITVTGTFFF